MQSQPLRIATRGSPLALWQANDVRNRLLVEHGLDAEAIELKIITTSGDRIQHRPLRDVGGKGLFTKEIEEALLNGEADLAVHSMKDVPTLLPHDLTIACLLPREDVRDAFISPQAERIRDLPRGARVGTSSLRRQSQLKRIRPDLQVVDFRGNVETRLNKLERGDVHATLLAFAGLTRLGIAERATSVIPTDEMLPAVAQGAIGVEIRVEDEATAALLAPLNDSETATRVACERAFLARLDGSCRTPIAGLAVIREGRVRFRGLVLTPDGSRWHETKREGGQAAAEGIGLDAADDILDRAGPGFLSAYA